MAIAIEDQLNTTIGKNPLLAPRTSLQCTEYAGGIPYFDDILEHRSELFKTIPTNIHLRPLGVEISIMYKFKLRKVGLPFNDIISVHIEDKQQIMEYKEKSVIGRALVGGLLFGPMGAIIGGMTGIGTKQVVAYSPDLIMTVTYNDGHAEKIAVFTSKFGDRGKLYKGAKEVFGSRFILNNPVFQA